MNQSFTQQITQTLEHCLNKMSKSLNHGFNPDEKTSLQLLQQYRSTITAYQGWLKKIGQSFNNQAATATQSTQLSSGHHTAPNKNNNEKALSKRSSYLKQSIIEQEKKLAQLLSEHYHQPPQAPTKASNQPSALLCKPG